MYLLKIAWKNLTNKPLSMALSLLLFALGSGLIAFLLNFNQQLDDKFRNNLAGIDLVIGAKGSPLQLILSSMYHIDAPTGNVQIEKITPFLNPNHPLIEMAVPLSLGDSHKGYRIVGTEKSFFVLYGAEVQEGHLWKGPMEATIGAGVAEALSLKIGDSFKSSHGFVQDENLLHEEAGSIEVVGILAPTGSVVDQLILTKTQTVWAVHDHQEEAEEKPGGDAEDTHDHEADHGHDGYLGDRPLTAFPEKQITSLLITFKGRNYQALNMQRAINENTELQAATPAIEINRVNEMLGVGVDALRVLALAIVLVSGLSIFISLFSSLRERRYELALLRTAGASPAQLFLLVLLEGVILAVLGYVLGILLAHLSLGAMGRYMEDSFRYNFRAWHFLTEEAYLLAGAIALGIIAAVIPAIQARNTDISQTLSEA